MDKEKIEYDNKFTDLAECTEYYFDEFGKLNVMRPGAGDLSRKEARYLHKMIMFSLITSLGNLKLKMKSNDKVEKTEIKEFNKEFKQEHKKNTLSNMIKATFSFPKRIVNLLTGGKKCAQVELIPSEEAKVLLPPADGPSDPPEAKECDQGEQQNHSHQPPTSEEVVNIEDVGKNEEAE